MSNSKHPVIIIIVHPSIHSLLWLVTSQTKWSINILEASSWLVERFWLKIKSNKTRERGKIMQQHRSFVFWASIRMLKPPVRFIPTLSFFIFLFAYSSQQFRLPKEKRNEMKWRSKIVGFFSCSTCFKCEFFAPLKMRRKKGFLMFSFQQLFGRNIMMSTIEIMALKYSRKKVQFASCNSFCSSSSSWSCHRTKSEFYVTINFIENGHRKA